MEDHRDTFTPFVTSVDGLLHREACTSLREWPHVLQANVMHKHMATSGKAFVCHHQSSQPMPKGFQVKWRSGLGFEDGDSLYSIMHALIQK